MLLGISFWRAAGRPESPAPGTCGARRRTHHRHPAAAGTPLHISTCHIHATCTCTYMSYMCMHMCMCMHMHVTSVHAHVPRITSPQRPGLLTGSRPPGLRPGLHPRTRSFERPNGTYFLKYRDSWVWTVHVDGSDGPRLVTTTRGGQSNLQEKVGRCTLETSIIESRLRFDRALNLGPPSVGREFWGAPTHPGLPTPTDAARP